MEERDCEVEAQERDCASERERLEERDCEAKLQAWVKVCMRTDQDELERKWVGADGQV